jgi:mannose-1-phosphate guanylyltransferase/mannose-6-phosphate isomerase
MTLTNNYAAGQRDTRPWGDWEVLDAGPGYVVKRIRVSPGGILSLQRHRHRAEDWTIVGGTGRVTLDDKHFDLAAGQTAHVNVGEVHRIANPGAAQLIFIEVQTGDLLSEDDIERLEDSYGRT